MGKEKSDLIFHPIRMRIMTELVGRAMTTGQLAAVMADVAQATLYRQIKVLLEGRLIEVTAEQVVNGATERTYRVVAGQANLTDEDLQGVSADEHIKNFTAYAALLIDTFSRYVQQADLAHMGANGLSYNRTAIYLSDDERANFETAVEAIFSTVVANQPSPERKRYTLASVVIPDERRE